MLYKTGVVIGKFYPFHNGHKHLTDTAESKVSHLYIIICGKDEEVPNPILREKWIKELYDRPNIIVKRIVDIYDPDDSSIWADLTKETIGCTPDIVFTSENYGHEYARCLNCVHELVDINRISIPISGTLIRSNPYKHWDYLNPVVRQFYTIRIVFCGPESTGKTTLSSRLAEELNVAWVAEFGREYCESFDILTKIWIEHDFEIIANKQNKIENEAAKNNKMIICDTDSLTTNVWAKRYTEQETDFKPDYNQNTFYIFSHVEGTELIDDGTRVDSNDEIRSWMHKELLQIMNASGRPVIVLTGTYEQRYEQAKEYIVNIYKKIE
jgi:NadR type nicotinamide-nucleotide adenylyltransferase